MIGSKFVNNSFAYSVCSVSANIGRQLVINFSKLFSAVSLLFILDKTLKKGHQLKVLSILMFPPFRRQNNLCANCVLCILGLPP